MLVEKIDLLLLCTLAAAKGLRLACSYSGISLFSFRFGSLIPEHCYRRGRGVGRQNAPSTGHQSITGRSHLTGYEHPQPAFKRLSCSAVENQRAHQAGVKPTTTLPRCENHRVIKTETQTNTGSCCRSSRSDLQTRIRSPELGK